MLHRVSFLTLCLGALAAVLLLNTQPQVQAKDKDEDAGTLIELKPVILKHLVQSPYLTPMEVIDGQEFEVGGKRSEVREKKGELELKLGSDKYPITSEGGMFAYEAKDVVYHVGVFPDELGRLYICSCDAMSADFDFGSLLFIDANFNGRYFDENEDLVAIGPSGGFGFVFQPEIPLIDANYRFEVKNDGKKDLSVRFTREEFRTQNQAREQHNAFNRMRMNFGLFPTLDNDEWNKNCQAHCQYMEDNDYFGHPEDPKTPGYTKEGHLAGTGPILSKGGSAVNGMLCMLGTPFHGWCMRAPWFTRAGFGALDHLGAIYYRLKDYPDMPLPQCSIFPPNNATGVPIRWNGAESPDPRAKPGQDYGYPITFYNDWGANFSPSEMNAKLEVEVDGKWQEVPIQLSWQGGPVQPAEKPTGYTFIMSEGALRPNSLYRLTGNFKLKAQSKKVRVGKKKKSVKVPGGEGDFQTCFRTGAADVPANAWDTTQQR